MAEVSSAPLLWLAFALAFVLGAIGQRTHFCTMGAVADILNMGDWQRMRMWWLAIGVAILGAGTLHAAGLINLDQSIYRGEQLRWLSHVVGGLCFGIGMVLASGCGAKNLIRLGGGNLKALVVCLVLAVAAYMTLRGLFAGIRVNGLDAVVWRLPAGQDLPALLAVAGLSSGIAFWTAVLASGGGLLLAALRDRETWSMDFLLGGLGTGLLVVAAWYVSGHLGFVAEHPETLQAAYLATNSGRMESLSFVAPQAYGLELLMLWSDTSRKLTFGIASALGVIGGSLTHALICRTFRWEGFVDLEDLVTHLLGALLMGFGGVTALGCSIGQGITGVSTLALGSIITLLAIIGGAILALRIQTWRLMRA